MTLGDFLSLSSSQLERLTRTHGEFLSSGGKWGTYPLCWRKQTFGRKVSGIDSLIEKTQCESRYSLLRVTVMRAHTSSCSSLGAG